MIEKICEVLQFLFYALEILTCFVNFPLDRFDLPT